MGKTLAAKFDSLSLIPWSHVGERTDPARCLTYVYCDCMCPHIFTSHKISKIEIKVVIWSLTFWWASQGHRLADLLVWAQSGLYSKLVEAAQLMSYFKRGREIGGGGRVVKVISKKTKNWKKCLRRTQYIHRLTWRAQVQVNVRRHSVSADCWPKWFIWA